MNTGNSVSTVTAKGQVTLRRAVRDRLGVRPGQRVEFVALPDGRTEVRAARGIDFSSIIGILKRPGQQPATLEDIDRAIARGWAGEIDMHSDGDR